MTLYADSNEPPIYFDGDLDRFIVVLFVYFIRTFVGEKDNCLLHYI